MSGNDLLQLQSAKPRVILLINQSIAISKYFEERHSMLPIKSWKQYQFQQYQELSMLQCHDPTISGTSEISFSMLFRKSIL